MTTSRKITGDDILLVSMLAGTKNYAKGTKMEGQTYETGLFEGKAFTTNDPRFRADLEKGDVYLISFEINEDGQLSLSNWITWTRKNNLAKNQKVHEAITSAVPKALSVEDLLETV